MIFFKSFFKSSLLKTIKKEEDYGNKKGSRTS